MGTIVAAFIILGVEFRPDYRVLSYDRFAWFKDEEFRFMIAILAIFISIVFFSGNIDGDLLTRFRLDDGAFSNAIF